MDYSLPKGLTSEDILFWFLEIAQNKYRTAIVFIASDDFGSQQVTRNLDVAMYECFCPFDESFDVYMECANGDRLSYEAIAPNVLRISGLSEFEEAILKMPPPQSNGELTYGDLGNKQSFRISQYFYSRNAREQLSYCMNTAVQYGAKLFVSAKENHGQATQVLSKSVLTGYEDLIDIVMRFESSKWILIHLWTGMVYTEGFDFSTAVGLLGKIIKD